MRESAVIRRTPISGQEANLTELIDPVGSPTIR